MGKIRIYELARELNMTNKQLLEKLEELGIPVKSHMSSVEDAEVESIKDKIRGKKEPDLVEKRIRPSVIRRRKVKAPAKPAPVAAEPADDQVDDQVDDQTDEKADKKVDQKAKKKVKKKAAETPAKIIETPKAAEKEAPAIQSPARPCLGH